MAYDPQGDTFDPTEAVKSDYLAWARALSDEKSRKAWLDFYPRYWSTEEGRWHLNMVAQFGNLNGRKI